MESSFMVLTIRHREFAPRYATREMRLPCARAQVCTREENTRMSDSVPLSCHLDFALQISLCCACSFPNQINNIFT